MRRLAHLFTAKAKEKQMNVLETLTNVLQTSAAVEIMNEVVLVTLNNSRETCVEMRELLEAKRDRRGYGLPSEAEDWATIVLDIAALDRVIDFYGG
jgi:hypothetical protein